MVICDCGLLDQKFHVDVEKPMDPHFEPLCSTDVNGHDPAKVPKFKYRHDGALSIRNFSFLIFVN
jgi:hypothetical protein